MEEAALGMLGDWTGVMKSLSSEIWLMKERSETQSTQSYIVSTRLNYHNLDVCLGLEAMERRFDSANDNHLCLFLSNHTSNFLL